MPSNIANATMSVGSVAMNASGTGSWFALVVLVGFVALVLGILISAITSLERYKKFWKVITWLGNSFGYFIYGIGAIFALGLPSLIVWWEISNASKGNVLPIKWTLIPIAIYIVIAGLGYLFKTLVVDRIKKLNKLSGQDKKLDKQISKILKRGKRY